MALHIHSGDESPPMGRSHTVQFDDIIFSLQDFGGISTYWTQISAALEARGNIGVVRNAGSRMTSLFPVMSRAPVFHSSYFRIPLSSRTRCVVTVHDLAFERGVVQKRTSVFSTALRARAIRRADAIVCVSQHTKAELLQYYPFLHSHPHIRVIHHGCGCIPDGAAGVVDRVTFGGKAYALFVGGRSGKYKNFFLALAAFALSKFGREARLVCSGTPLTQREMARARELNLEQRIHVLPHGSTTTLAELYKRAAVLLYPSSYEGFGFPVVEAMAMGCPVIGLNRSAIPEIAGEAGVLLSDLDAQAMADAIDRVVEPTYRSQLLRLGFENAARFTWAESAAAHEEMYRGLTI